MSIEDITKKGEKHRKNAAALLGKDIDAGGLEPPEELLTAEKPGDSAISESSEVTTDDGKHATENLQETAENTMTEAVRNFYEKHPDLEKNGVSFEVFADNVKKRLNTYDNPVMPDGKRAKDGAEGAIPIEDVINNLEHADTLKAVIGGVANKEWKEIVGSKPEKHEAEKEPEKPEESAKKKEKDPEEERLKDEARKAGDEYAKIDYDDRRLMTFIRKKFGSKKDSAEGSTPNIDSALKVYKDKVKELADYKYEKLKNSGLTGEELEKEMRDQIKYLNCGEGLNNIDAHHNAEMEYLKNQEGKGVIKGTWDKLTYKAKELADLYDKKVPKAVKGAILLGSIAVCAVPGAVTFAVGAPTIAGFTLGKRLLGTFMMGAAGGIHAEKGINALKGLKNRKETYDIMKKLKSEKNEEAKWDKFKEILDKKSNDFDEQMKNDRKWAQRGKIIAATSTLILGAGTTAMLIDYASNPGSFGETVQTVKSWFTGGEKPNGNLIGANNGYSGIKDIDGASSLDKFDPNNVNAGGPPDEPLPTGNNSPDLAQNVIQESENPTITPVPPEEAPIEIDHHEPVFDQNLTIEKGSSIEGTIIKQLKEMGVENPGAKAHRMFLEYMKENKDSIIEKVGADEYHKMLKDGMVNVQPGTELHIVADTGKDGFSLREVHGSMSHIEHNVAHIDIPDETHSDVHSDLTTDEISPEVGEVGNDGAEVLEYEKGESIQPSDHIAGGDEMRSGVGQEDPGSMANSEDYKSHMPMTEDAHVTEDAGAENQGVEKTADSGTSVQDFNEKHGKVANYRGLFDFVRAEDADSVTFNKTIASENAKSLARAVFGYNVDLGQLEDYLREGKIKGIMNAKGREEFLQQLPSGKSRKIFKEMLKATPPKLAHGNMFNWFHYVAMGAGRAKNLETFDTTGI